MLAQSNVRQAELRTLQTSQAIMASVVTAVGGVRNAALQLQRAREAVAASQAALDGEREKYRLGVGQLVDVLTMEDRLTVAEQTQVSAELELCAGADPVALRHRLDRRAGQNRAIGRSGCFLHRSRSRHSETASREGVEIWHGNRVSISKNFAGAAVLSGTT